MTLETILWTALVVVASMFVGWVLGNLYAISRMKSKRKSYVDPDTISGNHASEFARDSSGRPLYRVDKGDHLPEVLGERAFHEKVVKIVNSAAELGELKIPNKILNESDPIIEIVTHGDPRKA